MRTDYVSPEVRQVGTEPAAYSVPEVARMLGIPRSSAYEYVTKGWIPSVRIGRHIRITKPQLDAYLAGKGESGGVG